MFTERKISAFQNRISDLPDTPTLTASELKARFDACPEELRESLNGICDDGKILEDRMDEYRAQTFTGEITRDMLAPAVREELDSKADQKENTAAHETLDSRLTTAETQTAQKCELYFGTYTPSETEETDYVELGFEPKAVLLLARLPEGNYVSPIRLALPDVPHYDLSIYEKGFSVAYNDYRDSADAAPYRYIAFK